MMTEGLVAQSIGFASGARTLLAPVRHEYFRRVICDVFGREVEQGGEQAQAEDEAEPGAE